MLDTLIGAMFTPLSNHEDNSVDLVEVCVSSVMSMQLPLPSDGRTELESLSHLTTNNFQMSSRFLW